MDKLLVLFFCCVRFTEGFLVIVEDVPLEIGLVNASYINANLSNNDQQVSGSHEKKPLKKILQPPLAFSYSKAKQDSSSASSHDDTDAHKKHEHGGGKVSHLDHYSKIGKKGEKDYGSYDKSTKKALGHHDKEGHQGNYNEEGKKETKHFVNGDYHAEHDSSSEKEKASKFEEDGEHNKGHSTKGSHLLKDEDHYDKKIEFYDEFFDDGSEENFFDFGEEHDHEKGSSEKASHGYFDDESSEYGKKGYDEKGGHYDHTKGHKKKAGQKEHYQHDAEFGKAFGKKDKKEWGYSSGVEKKGKQENDKEESQIVEQKDDQYKRDAVPFKHYYKPENYTNVKSDNVDLNKIKDQYQRSTHAFEALESLVQSLENSDFGFIKDKRSPDKISSEVTSRSKRIKEPITIEKGTTDQKYKLNNADKSTKINRRSKVVADNSPVIIQKTRISDSSKCKCIKTTCDEE